MTLLTVAQFREHVTTSLGDDAIQRLLDDAEAAIVAFAGPVGSITELVDGGGTRISLSRPIDAAGDVSAISERADSSSPLTLAANDWALRGRYVLERLRTGTNGGIYWRLPVSVTYTPVDDTATRKMIQVELIKIEIAFNPALASETVGAWTQTYSSTNRTYPEWRADALGRLREPGMVVIN